MTETLRSTRTYTLDKERGEGNYKTVYKAKWEETRLVVAIAKLKQDTKSDAMDELAKEAWIQAKLNHPNIVSVIDFNLKDRFLVMEYVDRSLKDLINSYRGRSMPLDLALQIVRGILEGLAHAHDNTVVHGDLKPENVLVADNQVPKVSDFGIARTMGAAPIHKQGSSRWAAPEVLKGWKDGEVWLCDYQSDVFSFGIIAYLLLTGGRKHPFHQPSETVSVADAITDETIEVVLPSREDGVIPTKYVEVVMRSLERDKRKRFSTARDALNELVGEEYIQCPQCGGQNLEDASFCGSCGTALKVGARPSPPTKVRANVREAYQTAVKKYGDYNVVEAISLLKPALEENRDFAAGWAFLGFMYNRIRDHPNAIKSCDAAIAADPNLSSAYHTRGFAWSSLGDFGTAVRDFSKALELTPQADARRRNQILYNRAYAYMRLDKRNEACADAKLVLEFDPANEKAAWVARISCPEYSGQGRAQ